MTRDRFCVESGAYSVMIGYSSERIAVSGTIQAEGEVIPPRNLAAITRAANYDDYSDVYLDECQAGGTCVVHQLQMLGLRSTMYAGTKNTVPLKPR